MNRKLRVCYYGSYDWNEPHNSTHILGMQQAGIEVIECNRPAAARRDAVQHYRSLWRTLAFAFTFIKNSFALFASLWRLPDLDAIVVGYPGFFDVPLARLISRRRGIPLLFNVHISLYETLVSDRGYFKAGSRIASLLKWYDRFLFRCATVVLTDTAAHAGYFARLYGLPREKFQRVFIGADPVYAPRPPRPQQPPGCTVLFYGTFIPLQGIEYIVQAAHLLRQHAGLRFEIIGRGQTQEQVHALAERLALPNLTFIDWVSREELVQRIADADICLGGQFGLTPKAGLVIGYKCFQMIAMGKAVIVSDSPGNRELLQHERDCLMCAPGNPEALAAAILRLQQDEALRRHLAQESRKTFEAHCSLRQIGEELGKIATSARAALAAPPAPRRTAAQPFVQQAG
ncbi:MAG: glycosyltransferase family 4 protein [candidate division KSB1 bacterium]|nr:glycosyltransferase family 4 protein [candidate division KSB1 bacterium]MDZ7275988.1 glycosyltransferase family 4 protein [candidate division KSB1 bacterium]MDZ7285730.1 glycosyltransferase family 4 protein [candidate division KSB1 bacterium]MDZ7298762.1 glycosyltransferase family 4 protein [candidate division KSB1 bacterium]MDZ7305945.1 glycosyltransferase family 4 protein [candidate division KSB1 bacterium]